MKLKTKIVQHTGSDFTSLVLKFPLPKIGETSPKFLAYGLSAKTTEYQFRTATLVSIFKQNKMKKIFLVMLVVFHIIVLQSCTPEVLNETDVIQACCGDEGEIPPPPPPPPPGDGLGD